MRCRRCIGLVQFSVIGRFGIRQFRVEDADQILQNQVRVYDARFPVVVAARGFKGKNVIFIFLLATMMIPVEITIPAIYLMFSKVHMLNTYSVQIFPGIANVFCLFMLKQYMDSPREK